MVTKIYSFLIGICLTVCGICLFAGAAYAQGTLAGTVTDESTGEPLPGSNILILQLDRGASANAAGEYSIGNIPVGTYDVRVTYIGYRTFRGTVTIDPGENELDPVLDPDYLGLDEVLVIGYGTRERRDLTGSVSKVTRSQVENVPVSNIESALSGRATGVQVSSASGLPGGEVAVRIRGAASLGAGNQPLYVVDGLPVTTRQTSTSLAGNETQHTTSALADLNPSDIESIEILKDAASAAIYGSRASNGVILITTKRGRAQQTEVTVNHFSGAATETNRLDLLDGPGYVAVTREAGTAGSAGYPDPENAPTYNWLDAVHRTGYNTQTDIAFRGGDELTRFYVSGTYFSQEGYFIENRFQRGSVRLNIDHSVTENLRIGTNFGLTRVFNDRVGSDNLLMSLLTSSALNAPIRPIYLEDGAYNPVQVFTDDEGNVLPGSIIGNPAHNTVQEARENTRNFRSFRVIGNSFAEWTLADGLELRGSLGLDLLSGNEFNRYLSKTGAGAPDGSGQRRNEETVNWTGESTLAYQMTPGQDHRLDALAGVSYQSYQTGGLLVAGTNFPSDLFPNVASASEMEAFSAFTNEKWGLESYFSRLMYDYDDRYTVEGSARVDGSSRFGADNRYGFFPSASAGWRISGESFMDNAGLFDDLRLRVSWGLLGNDGIGDFASRALWAGNANYAGEPGLRPDQIESPRLKWEQTSQWDLGLDMALLNERIALSADYYYKYTSDMLLGVQLPYTSGFADVDDNIGEMKNSGIEFSLETQNVQGEFQWSTTFNITFNKNEVVSLVNDEPVTGLLHQRAEEGHPMGVFYLQEWAGVNPDTGLPQWYVVEEDGTRSVTSNYAEATRQHAGSVQPDFFGGFANSISYAGFDLSVFFQYVYGNSIYWDDGSFLLNPHSNMNKSTAILDRWRQAGDETDIPRFRDDNGNVISSTQASTRFLQDGSYLRLKDVTLTYHLPPDLVNLVGLQRANIYIKGTNLLTFTDYDGLDPELAAHGTTTLRQGATFFTPAQMRTVLAGIRFTL